MSELKRPWLSKEDNEYYDYIEEWEKTRKEFHPEKTEILHMEEGRIRIIGRVGFHSIKLGDSLGHAKVVKIEAYQKELDETGGGLTCGITFDKMPYFTIVESCPDYEKWIKERKNEA